MLCTPFVGEVNPARRVGHTEKYFREDLPEEREAYEIVNAEIVDDDDITEPSLESIRDVLQRQYGHLPTVTGSELDIETDYYERLGLTVEGLVRGTKFPGEARKKVANMPRVDLNIAPLRHRDNVQCPRCCGEGVYFLGAGRDALAYQCDHTIAATA
jgi:hypothetical protein